MTLKISSSAGAFLALLLAGCAIEPMNKVSMDQVSIKPSGAMVTMRLACPYALDEVRDVRPDGYNAGAVGINALVLERAEPAVRESLGGIGFGTTGPRVSLDIARLYVSQNLYTRTPVAVYAVRIDRQPERVIRSQVGGMSWSSSAEVAMESYQRALDDVNLKLVRYLNDRCDAPQTQ